jgi:uncharacterized membrane protein YtjA (UPF0391 family)
MACEGTVMLGWAVTFLIIAVIAGLLGFGGVAIISAEMAKIIFFVALGSVDIRYWRRDSPASEFLIQG